VLRPESARRQRQTLSVTRFSSLAREDHLPDFRLVKLSKDAHVLDACEFRR
jgi:hypothetical protein